MENKISMYQLTKEAYDIRNMIYDGVDEQMVNDTLEAMAITAEEKIQNVAYVDRELTADIEKLDAEIKYLQDKKKTISKHKTNLRTRVQEMMEALGIEEIKAGVFTAKIVGSGGLKPMEVQEDKVPDEYMKITYEIDKEKIRTDLENGKELSFAKLLERGKSLRLK